MNSPARLAIVLSHPTQYYAPWFRWLAEHGWTLRVFYLWNFGVTLQRDPGFDRAFQWDVDLLSGYDHEFVPNRSRRPGTHGFFGLNNPTLLSRLHAWRPDVVLLYGYKFRTHLRLIARSPWPLIFRGDSHLLGQSQPSGIKRRALHWIYSRFAAVTYVGRANREYFRVFGVPEQRLFFAPHSVDAERFAPSAESRAQAAALKASLGLDDRRVVLFAGKLTSGKQPRMLLQAFLDLAPRNAALVFVGDGEERSGLAALAKQHPAVRLLPFANQSEMPARYQMADVFALPSKAETWGLGVNEAMHMGTPCLVTDRVGCQQDLVTDEVTGWVCRADSPEHLRDTLRRALDQASTQREALRAAVQARVAAYSFAAAASGLESAVALAVGQRHTS